MMNNRSSSSGVLTGFNWNKHKYKISMRYLLAVILILLTCTDGASSSVIDDDIDGSGEADGDKTVLVSIEGQSDDYNDKVTVEDAPYSSTQTARDVVDKFLSIVDQYEQNKDNCTPGTEFNLGEGVVAQYGVKRFKAQALAAVNRANLLTRLWKGAPRSLLRSEYFFYTQVRNLVESDNDIFAAGNCYGTREYKKYDLWCPFAYRMSNDSSQIMVKDLAVVYKYPGNESEFFWIPRQNAEKKLSRMYSNTSIGKHLPDSFSCSLASVTDPGFPRQRVDSPKVDWPDLLLLAIFFPRTAYK